MTEQDYITASCLRTIINASFLLRQAANFDNITGKEIHEVQRLLLKIEEKLFKKVGVMTDDSSSQRNDQETSQGPG